jgi:hypothetical protein
VNSQGQVPCIQHDDGKTIYESYIISEYLVNSISNKHLKNSLNINNNVTNIFLKDEIYPQNKLIPSDPFYKAKSKMLVETFQVI